MLPYKESDIIKLYKNGSGITPIARKYKCHETKIRKILTNNNIKIKIGRPRTCQLNENVFKINSNERDYWVGFLTADGNLRRRGNSYEITLVSKDREHIEKYKNFLSSTHKIGNCSNGKCVRLHIRSEIIYKDLQNFGMEPRKSNREKIKHIENSIDFWRGVVDGDGSLGIYSSKNNYKNRERFTVCGSKKLLIQFNNFLFNNNISPINIFLHNNIHRITVDRNHAKTIIKLLYKNSTVSLNRKQKIANEIIKMYEDK